VFTLTISTLQHHHWWCSVVVVATINLHCTPSFQQASLLPPSFYFSPCPPQINTEVERWEQAWHVMRVIKQAVSNKIKMLSISSPEWYSNTYFAREKERILFVMIKKWHERWDGRGQIWIWEQYININFRRIEK
jgi:hypothetical protein